MVLYFMDLVDGKSNKLHCDMPQRKHVSVYRNLVMLCCLDYAIDVESINLVTSTGNCTKMF